MKSRERTESVKQPKIEGELEYTRGFLRYSTVYRPQVHKSFNSPRSTNLIQFEFKNAVFMLSYNSAICF
jgi:hypothetical protein